MVKLGIIRSKPLPALLLSDTESGTGAGEPRDTIMFALPPFSETNTDDIDT